MAEKYHIHMVSDSTGETVNSVLRSAMVQFADVEYQEHTWPLVRTSGQMERVMEGVSEYGGIVLHTIMDDDLRLQLSNFCRDRKIPCLAVLRRILRDMSAYFGVEPKGSIGRHLKMDAEYFARVDAMDYALAHDDGQNAHDLEEADVVLVGVSRTSKTPTSIYLSHRGLKAANVPYVMDIPLPEELFNLKTPLVIGLLIAPERLVQIRKSRLLSLHEQRNTDYVDLEKIKQEVKDARKLFNEKGWKVIDVTRRSIEETTAMVVQIHEKHVEGMD